MKKTISGSIGRSAVDQGKRLRALANQNDPKALTDYLLKHPDLDVNERPAGSGMTALHRAASKHYTEQMAILLVIGQI